MYDCAEKSKLSGAVIQIKNDIESFHRSINSLHLNQFQTNEIYKIVSTLLPQSAKFSVVALEENPSESAKDVIHRSTDMIISQLNHRSTVHKRQKHFKSNDLFIEPKASAIGLRWERRKVKRHGKIVTIPRLIQNIKYGVSIIERLISLFRLPEFEEYYFKYNSTPNHVCNQSQYVDYCCGSTFQSNDFFQNPFHLKIQLYADELEICNPIGSKSGIHKICNVYFTIRNLPREFSSKLNNIFVVCLINSNDLKSLETDFNNVWHPIVNDLKYLETHGIKTTNHGILKGTLTHLSFDNLGANLGLGFASSFAASNYCRFCMLSKTECQYTVIDDKKNRRTRNDYDRQIEIINNSEKVKYVETKGVKYYCDLNDLNHFKVSDNPTCDIMHDHNEGSIPHLLHLFFDFCISNKMFSSDQLRFMFEFHDYGWMNRKNIPSQINLDVHSIGQNASQSICLFRRVPFVLYDFKDRDELKSHWKCIQLLLKILVIIYSYKIREVSLKNLEAHIKNFLETILETYNVPLIPKLHFLTHYPSIIRMVGPVAAFNTIRYEAKHQDFKHMSHNTKNFKNIIKSLALKHEQNFCEKGVTCGNIVTCQKPKKIPQDLVAQHEDFLLNSIFETTEWMETKSLQCDNYEYRYGFLFIHDSKLYQIHNIFCLNENYVFASKRYEIVCFNEFLNSFQVKEKLNEDNEGNEDIEDNYDYIHFKELKNKVSYEIIVLSGNEYVIEEDLDFRYELNYKSPLFPNI